MSNCGRFWIISWGWSKGNISNKSCGVLIALNAKTLPHRLITQRLDPTLECSGRFGAVKLQVSPGQALAVASCYAPQEETTSTQEKDRYWKMVHHELHKLPQRCTMAVGGDFNGDLISDPDDRLAGEAYRGEKSTDNGTHLHTLAHTFGLKVPHTWGTDVVGWLPEGWRGETFFGNGNTRIDFLLVTKYTNTKHTWVDISGGYDMIMGSGTTLNDHVPIGMTIEYDVNVRYQAPPLSTKWNYAHLRLANLDMQYREKFVNDIDEWAKQNHHDFTRLDSFQTDPSPHWQKAHQALYDIAYEHYGAPKNGPKKPWMSSKTWELVKANPTLRQTALKEQQQIHHHYRRNETGHFAIMMSFFKAWSRTRQLQKHIQATKHSITHDKKNNMKEKVVEMIETAENRDYRTVWTKGRQVAQTGLGPKRRVYLPPDKDLISHPEWNEHMQITMEATPVTCLPTTLDEDFYARDTPTETVTQEDLANAFKIRKTTNHSGGLSPCRSLEDSL